MKSRVVFLALFLALGLPVTGVLAQDETGEQAESAATVEVADSERDRDRAVKAEARAQSNSWWHANGVAEALKLSEEQRQQMDKLRVANQEKSDAQSKSRRELEQQLTSAFLSGDLGKARRVDDELTQQTAVKDNALKFEVLSQLSEEQMEVLKTQYPHVLSESWRRNTRRLVENKQKSGKGRGRGGKGRGKGANEEPKKDAKDAEDAAGKDD